MDMNYKEHLLLKYAGLKSSENSKSGMYLNGPLKVKGRWFNIELTCPTFPKLSIWEMRLQLNYNVETISNKNLNTSPDWTVVDLLENLPDLLTTLKCATDSRKEHFEYVPKLEQNIYAEIANLFLPSEYEIKVNESCSAVRFCNFAQYEQHYLEVRLPSLQLVDHSLPICVDWQEMLGKSQTLTALLQHFRKLLEDLASFYENFTDIDELCHVVQPTLPTTKENWRLFVLKERIFLKLQFSDPFAPLSSMTVHIIGPTTEVANLRRIYSEGLCDWDSELDVHKNLLRIFDLCFFPMPPPDGSEASLQFCNICYTYKLDTGEIPIISCDNSNCSLIFHAECLKEWFSTLADGKTFLDVAFGACPFCKSKLSTSFQELLQLK